MNSSFETDPYPGRPRILFIGPGDSTHTHAWIELLEREAFNVRLFIPPLFYPPPADWKIRSYLAGYNHGPIDPSIRKRLIDRGKAKRLAQRSLARIRKRPWDNEIYGIKWLVQIIRDWRPQIVHTFQFDVAEFYFRVRREYEVENGPKWVLTVRGGPELALRRHDPAFKERLRQTLTACDQLVADNQQNYDYALSVGVQQNQISLGVVPGTGGIDVTRLAEGWKGTPSERKILLVPKAYEWPQGKALPVLEALKLAKIRMPPCEVHMLAVSDEVRMWFHTLPDDVRELCFLYERIPREQALRLMTASRAIIMPSLSDGVPNAMYEAMAAGALPIVSPLETILPLVADEQNVLFARNLYPEEIAGAIVRAMTDDALVDAAARRNLELVKRIANRDEVRRRVVSFYDSLAGGAPV